MSHLSTDHGFVADELKSGLWHLDPVRSEILFTVPHLWGLRKVRGRFDRFEATFDLTRKAVVELDVDTDSVRTGSSRRDGRLRTKRFLNAGEHPCIEFRSDDVVVIEEALTIDGKLLVGGHSVVVLATGRLHDRRVEHELNIEVVAQIDQTELGMSHNPLHLMPAPTQALIRGTLVRDRQSQAAAERAQRATAIGAPR